MNTGGHPRTAVSGLIIRWSRVRVPPAPRPNLQLTAGFSRLDRLGIGPSQPEIPALYRRACGFSAMRPLAQQTQLSCEDSLVTALPDARAKTQSPVR